MSVNVTMKFTLDSTKSKTQTLSQIRATLSAPRVPQAPRAPQAPQASRQSQSRFSMRNLGRTPCMQFNKPSVNVDCGCAGGKRG